jgi:hypothetical protein
MLSVQAKSFIKSSSLTLMFNDIGEQIYRNLCELHANCKLFFNGITPTSNPSDTFHYESVSTKFDRNFMQFCAVHTKTDEPESFPLDYLPCCVQYTVCRHIVLSLRNIIYGLS